MNDWVKSEAAAIGQRLETDGFAPSPLPIGVQYHQRKFMLSRFGIVDRVVMVRTAEQVSGPLELNTFEEESVAAALAAKVRWPGDSAPQWRSSPLPLPLRRPRRPSRRQRHRSEAGGVSCQPPLWYMALTSRS